MASGLLQILASWVEYQGNTGLTSTVMLSVVSLAALMPSLQLMARGQCSLGPAVPGVIEQAEARAMAPGVLGIAPGSGSKRSLVATEILEGLGPTDHFPESQKQLLQLSCCCVGVPNVGPHSTLSNCPVSCYYLSSLVGSPWDPGSFT